MGSPIAGKEVVASLAPGQSPLFSAGQLHAQSNIEGTPQKQSLPYGAGTAERNQGGQVNSATVENESQKKYRRISDKSQDHQRFFKNLVEVPATQMNQHQGQTKANNFHAS